MVTWKVTGEESNPCLEKCIAWGTWGKTNWHEPANHRFWIKVQRLRAIKGIEQQEDIKPSKWNRQLWA